MLTFREDGGGGGGFPAAKLATEDGFDNGFGGGFFKFANGLGTAGADSAEGGIGGLPPGIGGAGIEGRAAGMEGGRDAADVGNRGAAGREVSESE